MATALDVNSTALTEHERNFVAKIREYGFVSTSVAADAEGPGFSYTTGFWLNVKFPEIITFTLANDVAHDTFWYMYKHLKDGGTFKISEPTRELFENSQSLLLQVNKGEYPEFLGWNRWFYGNDSFKCLQLVWPDREGRFPWDPGASAEFVRDQPDLTKRNWLRWLQ